MPPVINPDSCNLCTICQDVCPGDIIHIDRGITEMIRYPDECSHCDVCRKACPTDAITMAFPWQYHHSTAAAWDRKPDDGG